MNSALSVGGRKKESVCHRIIPDRLASLFAISNVFYLPVAWCSVVGYRCAAVRSLGECCRPKVGHCISCIKSFAQVFVLIISADRGTGFALDSTGGHHRHHHQFSGGPAKSSGKRWPVV